MNSPRRRKALCAIALLVWAAFVIASCGDGTGETPASPSPGPATSASPDPGLSPEPVPSKTGEDGASGGAGGTPVVYLLGGSSARECVVSNASWAAEMKELGAGEVEAVDLGDTNRTFSQDLAYVRAMDDSRPTVVLIGVNLGRYTFAPSPGLADKPLTGEEQAGIDGTIDLKHRYSIDRIRTDAEKEAMVEKWLDERDPLFRRHYEGNHAMLAELVEASQKRGFYPVLVDLPLNLEIADGRLDEPREVYLEDSQTVADELGIPLLAFVEEVDLKNGEFYDIAHLVEPGRDKWQARLSREVVKVLRAEGLAPD